MVRSSLQRRLAQLALTSDAASTSVPSSSSLVLSSSSQSAWQSHQRTFSSSPSVYADSPAKGRADNSKGSRANAARQGDSADRGAAASQDRAPRRTVEGAVKNLPSTYEEWANGPGKQMFEQPRGRGPHWVAETPFPMNPTFKPAPPIAQRTRDYMWKIHKSEPKWNSLRSLSFLYGITLPRVQAILRLKALEDEMKAKNMPLQTDFQAQMDNLLGAIVKVPGGSTNLKHESAIRLRAEADHAEASPMEERSGAKQAQPIYNGRIFELEESADVDPEADEARGDAGLAQSLNEEANTKRARKRAIATGGPEPLAKRIADRQAARQKNFRATSVPGRASWSTSDLGRSGAKGFDGEVYPGASSSRRMKKLRRQARKAATAPTAGAGAAPAGSADSPSRSSGGS